MDWNVKEILDSAKVIVLDIETNSLDIEEAKTRVVGVRTNKSPKVHCIWAKDFNKLRTAIRKADHVVTYNGENFDIPVLLNSQNKLFKYESTIGNKHIDLYDVVTKRESTFGVPFLDGFTLDGVCKALKLSRKIGDFDYKLLYKEPEDLTPKEKASIEKYLTQDVNMTYELYSLIEEMFQPLAEFMPLEDVKKKNYIKSSVGSMTYKIVCHMAGLEPRYNQGARDDSDTYKGGLVFEPVMEHAVGNIKCVDFTSAYPHAFMQANLYTKCKHCVKGACKYRFTGGKTPDGHELKLQGEYCTRYGMGVIEKVIKTLFLMRLDAKKEIKKLKKEESLNSEETDRKNYLEKLQHALKIIINTIYGISGSEKFLVTYDADTAADCTRICRFHLEYLHYRMGEYENKPLYGDTDSCYALCPVDLTRIDLDNQLKKIVEDIKSIYPFPQETFNIEIEDDIEMMQFFADDMGVFKKKRYVVLQADGKVKAKGLSIVKRDSSFLARKIWDDFMIPYIKENKIGKIPKSKIDGWITDLITEDMSNAAIEFKVKPPSEYKNDSSIQARIAIELGEGRHKLIRNVRGIGIGKNVKYATLEQAKDFTIYDLDLARVYSDLADLTKSAQKTFDRFMI